VTLNRHQAPAVAPNNLSEVRLVQRVGEVKPYHYPSLLADDRTAIVTQGDSGLWYPANWLAEHLAAACNMPYLSDDARGHFKAIGIKFIAKTARPPQP
jgi:hypothetical protein